MALLLGGWILCLVIPLRDLTSSKYTPSMANHRKLCFIFAWVWPRDPLLAVKWYLIVGYPDVDDHTWGSSVEYMSLPRW